jgi:hypothetical protein
MPNLFPNFSRIHYARSNGDFPEVYRSDANRPERLSDHDMPVANSWITIEAGSLGTGNGMVTYRVAITAGPGSRSGTITVAVKTFTVKQK